MCAISCAGLQLKAEKDAKLELVWDLVLDWLDLDWFHVDELEKHWSYMYVMRCLIRIYPYNKMFNLYFDLGWNDNGLIRKMDHIAMGWL
jgi:hypothetical protein